MSAIYLAVLSAAIATGYFFTTGDVVGTLGITFWYVYYAGLVLAEEGFFDFMKMIASE